MATVFFYLNPFALQQDLAPACHVENGVVDSRKSRHGCHELQFFLSLPVHFTYRRNEQVSEEILPVPVVHFTTTF